MKSSPFSDLLAAAVQAKRTSAIVGLDPRWDDLPQVCRNGNGSAAIDRARSYAHFCHGIIDAVVDLVPAVKPQAAFFEELGPLGMTALGSVIQYAQARGLLVILDAKRGDIGSTAEAYARGLLGRNQSAWGADAITVNPYLGDDSLEPFVTVANERGAGIFVLVKTSNPGGQMLQDLQADCRPVYRHVADHVEQLAKASCGQCGYGSVGAVVGATYPEQLAELRAAMPHAWLLVPGFGSQGGTAQDVAGAFDQNGLGAIVNNSRGIIFAHQRPEYAQQFGDTRWQDAVAAATREMIEQLRACSRPL